MFRIVTCVMVVASTMAIAPPSAHAFWGWLEKLSGPGPFHQQGVLIGVRPICLSPAGIGSGDRDQPQPATRKFSDHFQIGPGDVNSTPTCFFIDTGRYVSENDPLVGGDVSAALTDVGITFEVVRGLEMGAGFGGVLFSSPGKTSFRWMAVPGRLVAKPFVWLPFGGPTYRKWAGIFKLYYKTQVILGRIDGSDFGIAPGTFSERHDPVSSRGVLLDFSELLRR